MPLKPTAPLLMQPSLAKQNQVTTAPPKTHTMEPVSTALTLQTYDPDLAHGFKQVSPSFYQEEIKPLLPIQKDAAFIGAAKLWDESNSAKELSSNLKGFRTKNMKKLNEANGNLQISKFSLPVSISAIAISLALFATPSVSHALLDSVVSYAGIDKFILVVGIPMISIILGSFSGIFGLAQGAQYLSKMSERTKSSKEITSLRDTITEIDKSIQRIDFTTANAPLPKTLSVQLDYLKNSVLTHLQSTAETLEQNLTSIQNALTFLPSQKEDPRTPSLILKNTSLLKKFTNHNDKNNTIISRITSMISRLETETEMRAITAQTDALTDKSIEIQTDQEMGSLLAQDIGTLLTDIDSVLRAEKELHITLNTSQPHTIKKKTL